MEKMAPAPKMNNKVEGTPKPESKKVEILAPHQEIIVAHKSFVFLELMIFLAIL